MSTAALVGIGLLLWAVVLLFVWALCRAAADADRAAEWMAWDDGEEAG